MVGGNWPVNKNVVGRPSRPAVLAIRPRNRPQALENRPFFSVFSVGNRKLTENEKVRFFIFGFRSIRNGLPHK